MKTVNYEDVLEILQENAEKNIMPYFERLQEGQIREKGPGNLVTDADEASEEYLEARLKKLLPGSLVVGEEAVSKDINVLKAFNKSDQPIWIIDPIDGTYNFAHSRQKWGVFISLAYKGEVVFANMYNVLGDELIFAYKGEGTHHHRQDQSIHQIHLIKPEKQYSDYIGHVGGAQPWHFKALNGLCGDFKNIRCSMHDAYDFLLGDIDFNLHKATTPWDHSAPALTISEAGGIFRIGDAKKPFEPHMMGEGYVLMTYDDESWDALSAKFFPALDKKRA